MQPKDIVRKIFDNVSFPVLLIDREYKIVEANRAALLHVSQPGMDVVGQPCFRITHQSDEMCWHSEGVTCPVKEAFETRKRVHTIHRHAIEDHLVIEEIVATPIEEDTGEIDYVVEEFRDIAELLELREGILPICASCNKIRSVKGTWHRIEEYIHDHTGADFSHSLCPACFRQRFPE